jgi:hypothetical protein
LTLAPIATFSDNQSGSRYRPTTKGEKLLQQINLANEIRMHLFSPEVDTAMADLDDSCARLEASMGRMSQVQWGSAAAQQARPVPGEKRDKEDDIRDVCFNHSWTPGGLDLGRAGSGRPKGVY